MFVLGMAGHIDHGKSSVLKALTGMDPTRSSEEKKRGMTMQQGYVHLARPDGRPIGIIDVPGHTDYRIATATAISAIDGFIFVVAANDGMMPQSHEHLETLQAFGVSDGLVILTKTDITEPDLVEMVEQDVAAQFESAFGKSIPVFKFGLPHAAVDIEPIRQHILKVFSKSKQNPDRGRPRLYVDRSFTVKGQGTVITGTLKGGELTERQTIETFPTRKKSQIKTIHAYGEKVLTLRPNSRCAMVVSDLETSQVGPGTQIALPGDDHLTEEWDARILCHPTYKLKMKKNINVTVAHFGVRTKAMLIPVAEESLGDGYYVRIKLKEPRLMDFGQPFLVLSDGLDRVIGSGRVLDPAPPRQIKKTKQLLGIVADYNIYEFLMLNLQKSVAVHRNQIKTQTTFNDDDLEQCLATFKEDFEVVDHWIFDAGGFAEICTRMVEAVQSFHLEAPAENGIPLSGLAAKLRMKEELLHTVARFLKNKKQLTQEGSFLKLPGFTPKVDTSNVLVEELEDALVNRADEAINLSVLSVQTKDQKSILNRYLEEGQFVRLNDTFIISGETYNNHRKRVMEFLKDRPGATIADLRDHLEIGRKMVVLVLDCMDRNRDTRREGNNRFLRQG